MHIQQPFVDKVGNNKVNTKHTSVRKEFFTTEKICMIKYIKQKNQ